MGSDVHRQTPQTLPPLRVLPAKLEGNLNSQQGAVSSAVAKWDLPFYWTQRYVAADWKMVGK